MFLLLISEDDTQANLLFQAMQVNDVYNISEILNNVEWNTDTVQQLQDAVDNASMWQTCYPHNLVDLVSSII